MTRRSPKPTASTRLHHRLRPNVRAWAAADPGSIDLVGKELTSVFPGADHNAWMAVLREILAGWIANTHRRCQLGGAQCLGGRSADRRAQ